MSRTFLLIGDPVGHSISPAIHAAAFAVWDEPAEYRAVRVDPRDVEVTMRRASSSGGGGNVTLPYKLAAASALDVATGDVDETGACNCFWGAAHRLYGDNTDVGGLAAALDEIGTEVRDRPVLLLGAGGAARAAVVALTRRGAARIDVVNRTAARARALADAMPRSAIHPLDVGPAGRYALVVNATRVGLTPGEPPPLDLERVAAEAVYDMVYAPGGTRLVRDARRRGIPAAGGVSMLVHQAALSLARWFPDRAPPIEAMREAAEAALLP